MSNTKKLLILVAILVLIPVIFSGCSLFKMLGLTGTTELDAPTGIVLSEDSSYISWTATPFATGYEIYIDGAKAGQTNINKYYFEDIDGTVSVQLKAISASNKYTPSELTASVTHSVKSRLVISGLNHVITASEFIIYWDDVDYKLNYTIKIYEDSALVDETVTYSSTLILSHYESGKDYTFEIIARADSSDKRVDSSTITYNVQSGAAPSIMMSAEYDKKAGVAPQFDNTNPSAIKIYLTISGSKIDITSNCIISAEKVEIKASYLNTLPVNVYYGEYDSGSRRFVLVLKDTRDLTLSNITFTKNEDYAHVDVAVYSNTIINIEIESSAMHTVYNYAGKIIIDGEFLDSLDEGVYTLSVLYGQEGLQKTATADVTVVTKPATIQAGSSYNYYGQYALSVIYKQNGDTITSLVLDGYGVVEPSNYQTTKNTIIISKDFLLANGNDTFVYCINTEKGSALLFTVITDIRDFAIQYALYTYDKASDDDMIISAIIVNEEDFDDMQGALITEDDYYVDALVGIVIEKAYVSQLAVGEYEFLCISGDVFDYFTLEVINSAPKPYNVRLNYDIHPDDVYITFDCDCSGGHTYKLNDGPIRPLTNRKMKVPADAAYNKSQTNTLRITCASSGQQTTIVKEAPAAGATAYLNARYNFEGENRDKYIESQEEFNHIMKYMAMRGFDSTMVSGSYPYSYVEETVFYAQDFLSSTSAETILNNGVGSFTSPWGYTTTTTNNANNVFTIRLGYTQYPGYNITTGYVGQPLSDSRDLLVSSDRLPSFNSFYIETRTKTQAIRNTTELIELPLGIKPIIELGSDIEELYEAAKDIARQYISSSMTDFEKVEAFYYWLITNVVYDYESIEVYNLSANVQASSNIGQATNFIDGFITLNPAYSALLTPIRDMSNLADMKKAMDVTVKRMRVFAAEGALLDGKAVCNGIANALLLLCKIEGIESIRVSGRAFSGGSSENHAWNKVKIDGTWYVVDATWGRMGNYVNHKYLFASDYSLYDTHREEQRHGAIRIIEYLATGHIDYYSTIIVEEYDLTIDSTAELNAVVAALYSQGVRTIELKYNLELAFSTAIQAALSGIHSGGYQTSYSGNIYIVNLNG